MNENEFQATPDRGSLPPTKETFMKKAWLTQPDLAPHLRTFLVDLNRAVLTSADAKDWIQRVLLCDLDGPLKDALYRCLLQRADECWEDVCADLVPLWDTPPTPWAWLDMAILAGRYDQMELILDAALANGSPVPEGWFEERWCWALEHGAGQLGQIVFPHVSEVDDPKVLGQWIHSAAQSSGRGLLALLRQHPQVQRMGLKPSQWDMSEAIGKGPGEAFAFLWDWYMEGPNLSEDWGTVAEGLLCDALLAQDPMAFLQIYSPSVTPTARLLRASIQSQSWEVLALLLNAAPSGWCPWSEECLEGKHEEWIKTIHAMLVHTNEAGWPQVEQVLKMMECLSLPDESKKALVNGWRHMGWVWGWEATIAKVYPPLRNRWLHWFFNQMTDMPSISPWFDMGKEYVRRGSTKAPMLRQAWIQALVRNRPIALLNFLVGYWLHEPGTAKSEDMEVWNTLSQLIPGDQLAFDMRENEKWEKLNRGLVDVPGLTIPESWLPYVPNDDQYPLLQAYVLARDRQKNLANRPAEGGGQARQRS